MAVESELRDHNQCGDSRPFIVRSEQASEGDSTERTYRRPAFTTCQVTSTGKLGPTARSTRTELRAFNDSCGKPPGLNNGLRVRFTANANRYTCECSADLDCKANSTDLLSTLRKVLFNV